MEIEKALVLFEENRNDSELDRLLSVLCELEIKIEALAKVVEDVKVLVGLLNGE